MTGEHRPLPVLLQPGLRIVFIGYNPGLYSAERGHYYAWSGNVFWRQLIESGIVGRPVGPEDDRKLPAEAGIGFVDLCARPTARADELTREEVQEGARLLLERLEDSQPEVAVFSGKGIFQYFGRHALGLRPSDLASRPYGSQSERIGAHTVLWVIPSSSGLASRWHRQRLQLLSQLASELPPAGPRS